MLQIDKYLGIVGDLHLGQHSEDQWYDTYDDLLDWIEASFLGKVNTIMFLGDIFDGKTKGWDRKADKNIKGIDFRMLTYVSEFFERLAKNFHVIAYAGNHCCFYKNRCDVSGLAMLKGKENITIVEKPTSFSVGAKDYRIVPWGYNIDGDTVEGDFVDGIFGHFDIQSFKMNNFKESDHGYSTKELFKHCDTVWTGHYHMRQDRSYQKGEKRVFYAGSPLQLSWSETGKDSYIHILDLEKNDVHEEFENTVSPKFKKVAASKLLKAPTEYKKDVLTVVWDIDNSEENQIKVSNTLAIQEVLSFKNDYSNVSNTSDVNTVEIKDINDSVDDEEIIDKYTGLIESVDDSTKAAINKKAKEFLNRVKV